MNFNEYVAENNSVLRLPRTSTYSKRPRVFAPHSLRWLMTQHVKSISTLLAFRMTAHSYRDDLDEIRRIRGQESEKSVLVVGNGPSRDGICTQCAMTFTANGNHIIAINEFLHGSLFQVVRPKMVVLSDPSSLRGETLEDGRRRDDELCYLQTNPEILLAVPLTQRPQYARLGLPNQIVPFVDSEARYSLRGERDGLSLLQPRSYLSATLYKALAVAIWLGYRQIFVAGMDNTYPRDLFVDSENHVLRRTRHASDTKNWCQDLSQFYKTVEDCLYEVNLLFHDIRKFSSLNIINLDPYSLTDAFSKSPSFVVSNGLLSEHSVCPHTQHSEGLVESGNPL